jgi:hypothetical protein
MQLVLDVEDKIRVLKHVEVWDSPTSTNEVPAMALQATTGLTDQLKDFLAHHITAELKCLYGTNKSNPTDTGSTNKDGKTHSRFQHQDWMLVPPLQPTDTKTVQSRSYNWCLKCNRGNGQWGQAHTTDTHQDGYRFGNRQRGDSTKCPHGAIKANVAHQAELPPTKRQQRGILQTKQVTFDQASTSDEHQPTAQLSLADSIPSNGFRFDVQDILEDE